MLFPQPDSPTNATFFPASISKFKPFKIGFCALSLGYINLIFLNSILPFIVSLSGSKFFSETYIFGFLSNKVK